MGKGLREAGHGHADLIDTLALYAKSWSVQRAGVQQPDSANRRPVHQYRLLLEAVRADKLVLPDYDLDSGNPTKIGEYSLSDQTYDKLLDQLAKSKFDHTTSDLRENILSYYSGLPAPTAATKDEVHRKSVQTSLDELKAMPPASTVASNPAQ